MHRVNEVERIRDGPFLLGLQIIVVEKAQNLLLVLPIVRIKYDQCPVVVKIALTETIGELKMPHMNTLSEPRGCSNLDKTEFEF